VRVGSIDFLSQFPSIATTDGAGRVEDPGDASTFIRSKLDWSERSAHAETLALHRDLLRLRREDPVIRAPRMHGVDGSVVNDRAFVLRFFGAAHGDRLLVVNLGDRVHADPFAEPLIALGRGKRWRTVFSTEDTKYGGWGSPPIQTADDGWWLPAECAALLEPTDDTTTAR
jgi:maltooligosyltrehalose trehalohydrolase